QNRPPARWEVRTLTQYPQRRGLLTTLHERSEAKVSCNHSLYFSLLPFGHGSRASRAPITTTNRITPNKDCTSIRPPRRHAGQVISATVSSLPQQSRAESPQGRRAWLHPGDGRQVSVGMSCPANPPISHRTSCRPSPRQSSPAKGIL